MKLKVGLAVAALVAAVGAWYTFSPSRAVTALADAIYALDADEIKERVDTVRVRDSLQSFLSGTLMGPVLDNEVEDPFEGFGRLAANSMLPAMVDRLVSPEGLRGMLEGQSNSSDPDDLAWEISRDGLNRFSAKLSNSDEAANFIFERDGLSWRLVEIRKPGDPFSQDGSSEKDSADASNSTPTARQEEGIISEWKRSNLNGVQNDTLMEYDCENRRYRVAALEVTDANGYKVEQTFPDDMPWHQVTDRDVNAQTAVVRVTNVGVDDYFRVCGRPEADRVVSRANLKQTSIAFANATEGSSPEEVWRCEGILARPFSVKLTDSLFAFEPINPDQGATLGALRMGKPKKYEDGTTTTPLILVGSGAPNGRWAYLQSPGKRRALIFYAVESSGDGNECVPPGDTPAYIFN